MNRAAAEADRLQRGANVIHGAITRSMKHGTAGEKVYRAVRVGPGRYLIEMGRLGSTRFHSELSFSSRTRFIDKSKTTYSRHWEEGEIERLANPGLLPRLALLMREHDDHMNVESYDIVLATR